MDAKVAFKIWKIQILMGYPITKVTFHGISAFRVSMFEMIKCVNRVNYKGILPSQVIKIFINYHYYIDTVYEVFRQKTNSFTTKVNITYMYNNKLKLDIQADEKDEIILLLPNEME